MTVRPNASQSLPITEEFNAGSVGTNFMPHIIHVNAGNDVPMQPDSSVGILSPDGRVVGGGVAGILVAASPVQVIVGSFLPSNQLEPKPKKLKNGSDRPREFLSLYPEGAENIKGVLQQNMKKKEEEWKHGLEEHGASFTKPELKQNEKEKEEQGPVGVVGAIAPRNFPLAMITRNVGPALVCGSTVVIKPSEIAPLTALAAAEPSLQAGIPPGVVNVVRKITFTGSIAVGKKLMAGAAGTVKMVSLEFGGNATYIIFYDADLDVAVKGTLAAKFRNSGQTCVCANGVCVQEGIYEKSVNVFFKAVQNLQVGDGFTVGVVHGPLINEAAVKRVEGQGLIFGKLEFFLGDKEDVRGEG
ncbi:succinate-semialdehyde dehydrogenase, mitochondrial-like [Alnus glutinosa]|uniref:succinate-semialdehyde dehydrogenase, mitochondrial-like n=1 Tax=Alnus glutinosa TaxID=3517 RepID=UPI002D788FF0|nr:succinate-semialdehyde dehydrogenase, mitochondrial-like [Alnus glutinosa]